MTVNKNKENSIQIRDYMYEWVGDTTFKVRECNDEDISSGIVIPTRCVMDIKDI